MIRCIGNDVFILKYANLNVFSIKFVFNELSKILNYSHKTSKTSLISKNVFQRVKVFHLMITSHEKRFS